MSLFDRYKSCVIAVVKVRIRSAINNIESKSKLEEKLVKFNLMETETV